VEVVKTARHVLNERCRMSEYCRWACVDGIGWGTHEEKVAVPVPGEVKVSRRDDRFQAALRGELEHEAHERLKDAGEELYDVGVVEARHHLDLGDHVVDRVDVDALFQDALDGAWRVALESGLVYLAERASAADRSG
jgi:hypothetical protein